MKYNVFVAFLLIQVETKHAELMSFNVNVIIAAFRGIGSVMVKMTVMMDPMRGTVVS